MRRRSDTETEAMLQTVKPVRNQMNNGPDRVVVETTEGKMEIDLNRMELYKQQGGLYCPMVRVAFGCSEQYIATCPISGAEYKITKGLTHWTVAHTWGIGQKIGETKL